MSVYSITIDDNDLLTLRWLQDRGYDADLCKLTTIEYRDDGMAVISFETEAKAWEWKECVESDPEAFLTCCGSDTLRDKLFKLLDSIV